MHACIIDGFFGSTFTNGSGRTADVLQAEVQPCTLLIWAYPLQPRMVCKHKIKVYNEADSGILNNSIDHYMVNNKHV